MTVGGISIILILGLCNLIYVAFSSSFRLKNNQGKVRCPQKNRDYFIDYCPDSRFSGDSRQLGKSIGKET